MGKAIATNKIGVNLHCEGDKFFDEQALANAGATTSGEFMLAQTLGCQEVKVLANGEVATGVGETLVITIVTSPTSGGTFDNTVLTKTIAASTTIADGEEIASYVPSRDLDECYTKVTVTSDYDASALKVDGIIVQQ